MEDEFARRLCINAVKQHIFDKLKTRTLQGITLKTVDNSLKRGDKRAPGAFLLWLQDQLKDWDKFSCQRVIQAFCDRLRLHHLETQQIFDSFHLWKLVQVEADPSLRSQLSAIEEELRTCLCRKHNGHKAPTLLPADHQRIYFDVDRSRIDQTQHSVHYRDEFDVDSCFRQERTTTMNTDNAIEVASGDEGSDGEPLRQQTSGNQLLRNKKSPKIFNPSSHKLSPKTNNMADNNDHHILVDMRGGKVEGNLPTKPIKSGYVCNRCSVPGKDRLFSI